MNHPADILEPADVRQARQLLRAMGHRYVAKRAAAVLVPAVAAAWLLVVCGRHWPAAQAGLAVAAVIGFLLMGRLLAPLRRLRPATIAPRLDRQFPALEDSTGLLLAEPSGLNLLEQLQQQRTAARLLELHQAKALALPVAFRRPALLTAGLLLAAAAVWWLPAAHASVRPASVAIRVAERPRAVPGQPAPRLLETRIRVTPPAYTRRPAFAPAQASFQCPLGSRVRWLVRVSGARGQRPELEMGRHRLRMAPAAGGAGWFFIEREATAPALYRLRFAGIVSEDYALDVRADQAPVVRIQAPRPYTLVAFGQRPDVPVRATLRDDYGLRRAELVITVAQGQGEAVKFREVRRELSAGLGGQPTQASLTSSLNLPRLGLTYGDELYFYVTASDNAGHSARTDAYLVQWQDTAVADSPADVGMGVKVAPAYFRSQRQIIIDTEKLLAEKGRLDAPTLAARANDLGFDQQTLRLRYGKFLGEEAEQGIGAPPPRAPIAEEEESPAGHPAPTAEADEHHDHPAAPSGNADASPTAATDELMEPYIHRHDDAETADFLEPAVKAKLRAVLDQMWAAELRLRTGQLAAARPFEYRALRLLKEVQQQTRVFVKKAGFVPPPLPETTLRLTGELAGTAGPRRQLALPPAARQPALRAALRWLAAGVPPRPADTRALEQAGAALAAAAVQRPGAYLPALRGLRQLVAGARTGQLACPECCPLVVRALTDLLAVPAPAPVAPPAPDRLARRYFQELSR